MISLYKEDGIIIEYSSHLRSNLNGVDFKHRETLSLFYISNNTCPGGALIEKYDKKSAVSMRF